MFTSDTERSRRLLLRTARSDFLAALVCAVFGAVYEHFSFGVYSPYMLFAFAVPLLLGALPALLLATGAQAAAVPAITRKLWHAGVASLTVGALFRGVLDIYGTASSLTRIYWVAGAVLLMAAAAAWPALRLHAQKNTVRNR